jgi:hypothetical protein
MNCELYDDLLDEYVNGIDATERRGDERFDAFERHLANCAACQALVGDLTSIRQAASTLEEHVPPPRLWAKIASSIEEDQRRPWWQRALASGFSGWVTAAATAAILVLIVGGAWMGWRRNSVEPPQQASASEPTAVPAEEHYEQAIAGLQQLADTQNAALDAKTRAVLRQNLAVIDRAIDESRAALTQEPASAAAQESLLDALETKVTLLQDTVALATETAGMPDEVAGARELNQ